MKVRPIAKSWLRFQVLSALVLTGSAGSVSASTDWSQPPLACIEEVIPRLPDRPCFDLTNVADPQTEWPEGISESELAYWQKNKVAQNYCRSLEIMRREELSPGTFSAGTVQIAWMRVKAMDQSELKVKAVYAASRANKMPAHVLTGALMQESLFATLGIEDDGGNFSCGIGQVNLVEWCNWANKQSKKIKDEMKWPANVKCSDLSPGLIRPFYEIAKTRLNGLPAYRLEKVHFQNIKYESVVKGFPSGPTSMQKVRYQAAVSFLNHCADVAKGIGAKANELRNLYVNHVPAGLKKRDLYRPGEEFARVCSDKGYTEAYPMNTGWLLAVGLYNAGPRAVDVLAHYHKWNKKDLEKPETWENVGPAELIEAFYWSGKYSPKDDKIHYKTLNGGNLNWIWFKACVLQRHIARVVQHVTLPGVPKLVDTLEGAYKCARSVFDPNTGKLVKSGVPPFRQKSPGVKVSSN